MDIQWTLPLPAVSTTRGSQPARADVVDLIEPNRSLLAALGVTGAETAASQTDYQTAQLAAKSGDYAAALTHLERLFAAEPRSVARAVADPVFEPLRVEIQAVVHRLTVAASLQAEDALERAASAWEHVSEVQRQEASEWVRFANLQIAAGGYEACFHAARAAQCALAVVERQQAESAGAAGAALRRLVIHRLVCGPWSTFRSLWLRLPLLALLLAWFAAGVAGGLGRMALASLLPELAEWLPFTCGYAIWALGLLGLVMLGFLRSIRRL